MKLALIFALLIVPVCFGAVPRLFQAEAFTSASFADAVNHYVALGEDSAVRELRGLVLDPIKDFERSTRGRGSTNERIGWMCRVLFDPKGAEPLRPPRFGMLMLPYDTMPLKNWPRCPVAHSGSTYFVLSEGYTVAGMPEDAEAYIEYCRTNGVFRKAKVPVPRKERALKDAAALRKSKAWTDIKWKHSSRGHSYTLHEGSAWAFIQKQADDIR